MQANRIRHVQSRMTRGTAAKPQPAAPTIPAGFAICPPQLMMAQGWQQELYRRAYEQAKAKAAVPRHYRTFFSVWN